MQVSFRGTITAHLYTDGSIAQASVLKVPVKKECAFSAGEALASWRSPSAWRCLFVVMQADHSYSLSL